MNTTILPFFPTPADSETIYSMACRFKTRSDLPNSTVFKLLTGQKSVTALLAGYSSHFSHISTVVPANHPLKNPWTLVRRHTILSYYMYFNSRECRSVWESKITALDIDANHQTTLIGLTRSPAQHPRFCPSCVKEDEHTLGFSCFRREHQLPGVAVCWRHGDILSHGCTVCGTYPVKQSGLHMAGKCNCHKISELHALPYLPNNHDALLWLAKESAYMLSARQPHTGDYYGGLRACAKIKGFDIGSREKLCKLSALIEDRFGKEFLNWLGISVWRKEKSAEWIKRFLVRKLRPENRKSSLHYLLIIGSLFPSVKAFEAEALRHMQSINDKIYPQRHITFEWSADKIKSHREIVTSYFLVNPKIVSGSPLRVVNSYKYLLGRDLEWLYENYPDLDTSKYYRPKLDWNSKDSESSSKIAAIAAEELQNASKPERLSSAKLLKSTLSGSLPAIYKEKYPLVGESLKLHVESRVDFNKRLIKWSIEQLKFTNHEITLENIHKTSGLRISVVKRYRQHIFELLNSDLDSWASTKSTSVKVTQMGLFD